MSCFVKNLTTSKNCLFLTKDQDYFVINNIFKGLTKEEKRNRLCNALLAFTCPCIDTEARVTICDKIQSLVVKYSLENEKADLLFSLLLPKLQKLLKFNLVVQKNGKIINYGTNEETTIFAVIDTVEKKDDNVIHDEEVELLLDEHNYNLKLIMTNSDFKKKLNKDHFHEIDITSSAEIFPFDFSQELTSWNWNFCRKDVATFSPLWQMINIQKVKAVATTYLGQTKLILGIKKITEIKLTHGYLDKNLPKEFFDHYLVQFYKIFQEEIDDEGSYCDFVNGTFLNSVESLNTYVDGDIENMTIYEQFLINCYHV